MSPALAGGFLTTAPPGKPFVFFLNKKILYLILVDIKIKSVIPFSFSKGFAGLL